jgi:hypothetical protein
MAPPVARNDTSTCGDGQDVTAREIAGYLEQSTAKRFGPTGLLLTQRGERERRPRSCSLSRLGRMS